MNDHIKREAENLYNDLGNVNVLALDMYDGKLATDPQTAGKYMQEFKKERGAEIKWINKEVTDKFEANMKAAGKKLTVKSYDADHAFANPSNANHNKKFTADAYKNTLAFFKKRLK